MLKILLIWDSNASLPQQTWMCYKPIHCLKFHPHVLFLSHPMLSRLVFIHWYAPLFPALELDVNVVLGIQHLNAVLDWYHRSRQNMYEQELKCYAKQCHIQVIFTHGLVRSVQMSKMFVFFCLHFDVIQKVLVADLHHWENWDEWGMSSFIFLPQVESSMCTHWSTENIHDPQPLKGHSKTKMAYPLFKNH